MVHATQLSSFMYCPRKLFISKVCLVEEPMKEALIKGEVWHKTFEWINKHEHQIVEKISTKNFMEISELYRAEFAKALRNTLIHHKHELKQFDIKLMDLFKEYWPNVDEEAKIRAWNVASFVAKHNIFGKELWEKLSPKILSEQYFKSEKLGLSGVIDVIELHDNILYVPVELKTGKVPDGGGMWPGHRMQLATYMMLLEDAGKQVSEGVLKYKDSDEKRVLVLNTLLKEEVLNLVTEVNKLIKSFEIPERVDNKKKCDKCSFREKCYDDTEMKRLVEEARKRVNI
jgi:CRISPR-associated exonuclease Cas4